MIRRRSVSAGKTQGGSFVIRLLLLALFFSAGVALGQVLSVQAASDSVSELTDYIRGYLTLGQKAELSAGTFASALVLYLRYPLLAFIFGFAAVGIVLIPALTVAFGFFLSFSVCCFTAAFGSSGVLLALSVFGIRCLVTLPCYFYLAVPSLQNSWQTASALSGRGKRLSPARYGSAWWIRLAIVLILLLAGVLAELWLTPGLMRFAMEKLLT